MKKPDFWAFFDQKIRWFGQNFLPNRTEPNRPKNTEFPNRTEPNRIFGRFLVTMVISASVTMVIGDFS